MQLSNMQLSDMVCVCHVYMAGTILFLGSLFQNKEGRYEQAINMTIARH